MFKLGFMFTFKSPFLFLLYLGRKRIASKHWREILISDFHRTISLFADVQGIEFHCFKKTWVFNLKDFWYGKEERIDHLDPEAIRITRMIEDSTGGVWKVQSGYFIISRKRWGEISRTPAWIYTEQKEGAVPFSANLSAEPNSVIVNIVGLRKAMDEELKSKGENHG